MKGQQQESIRKRSPPPGHPPPLVSIAKQRSASPQRWTSDHYSLLTRAEKPPTPYGEDMLRDLLSPYPRSPLIGRSPLEIKEEQQEEQGNKHVTHGYHGEQRMYVAQMSPKPFMSTEQKVSDNTHALGLLQRHHIDEALTLDFRIHGKALRESSVTSKNFLGEHLKYLPKTSSPQVYVEAPHAVPSYHESLTRHELESPFSLYGDGSRYAKSFPHYDYRSSGTAVAAAAAALYTVPEQALATPMDTLDSRLLKVMY